MCKPVGLRLLLAILFLLPVVGTARADVIDGEWCDDTGHHFAIKGPEIVTQEGIRTTGNYSRHAFSYSSPAANAPNSTEIFMRLINESTVHLRRGIDPAAPVEVWRRCEPVS